MRVLVVEDDPAVRRFVVQALHELPVEVQDCASVGEAMSLLARADFPLLIIDLVLSNESGIELIERLRLSADSAGQTKVVVFSAGLHAAMREKLYALGVWRCLSKPATQAEILECAREALGLLAWPEGPEERMLQAEPEPTQGLEPHELAAIEEYFDGDKEFFLQFRSSCLKQFVLDLAQGDQACTAGDAATLRRTVHSLKSILLTLGRADDSMFASSLEETVQKRPWEEAVTGWRLMRARMKASFGID